MPRDSRFDDVDREVLELLRIDARRSLGDIAEHVHLSATAVKRRIERLTRDGIILGYTTVVADSADTVEAFAQIRYSGEMAPEEMLEVLSAIDEVADVYIIAGDTDALVHLRMGAISELSGVIRRIRGHGAPISTTTLMVMAKRSGNRHS